ncbi:MAG: hypothetical protein H0V01_15010 [Bacteroidetes bacterium]|nr:hypothetical protein [Bacteroidota bacterium]HET6243776.1 hypothetical protein [Bacteroidia bacterium]
MKQFIVIILFCFSGTLTYSQPQDSKPIQFIYGINQLDSLILDLQMFPGDAMMDISFVKIPLVFTITDSGKVKDIKISGNSTVKLAGFTGKPRNERLIKKYFESQSIEICKMTEGLWIPAKENGNPISDTISHTFSFSVQRTYKKVFTGGNNFIDYNYDNYEDIENYPTDRIYRDMSKNMTNALLGKRYHANSTKYVQRNQLLIAEILIDIAKLKLDNNVDLLFDHGIIKQKLNKLNEACDSFAKGAILGDTEAEQIKNKYCK